MDGMDVGGGGGRERRIGEQHNRGKLHCGAHSEDGTGDSPRKLRLTSSRLLNTSTPQNMQCMTAVGHNETSLARCSLTVSTRLFIRPAANPGHLRGTQRSVLLMLPAFCEPLHCVAAGCIVPQQARIWAAPLLHRVTRGREAGGPAHGEFAPVVAAHLVCLLDCQI